MKLKQKIAVVVTILTLILTACSYPNTSPTTADKALEIPVTEINFHLWDETAARAYEKSFAAFTKLNPDIKVKIKITPFSQYWQETDEKISTPEMADIFWIDALNYPKYAQTGHLLDISTTLNQTPDPWQESVTNIYTYQGKLWGVPQLWESFALYYNKNLLAKHHLDPSTLIWSPKAEQDTLITAAKRLTVDEQGKTADSKDFDESKTKVYGFASAVNDASVYSTFLSQNKMVFSANAPQINFSHTNSTATFQYLFDLIHTHKVTPTPTQIANEENYLRNLFVKGELAVLQASPANLKYVYAHQKDKWGLAPNLAGTTGRISTVQGIAAAGNAHTKYPAKTARVLQWLGSKEGQLALGELGVGFPAVIDAQDAFINYWARRGIDASVFIPGGLGNTIHLALDAQTQIKLNSAQDTITQILTGNLALVDGLSTATEQSLTALPAN